MDGKQVAGTGVVTMLPSAHPMSAAATSGALITGTCGSRMSGSAACRARCVQATTATSSRRALEGTTSMHSSERPSFAASKTIVARLACTTAPRGPAQLRPQTAAKPPVSSPTSPEALGTTGSSLPFVSRSELSGARMLQLPRGIAPSVQSLTLPSAPALASAAPTGAPSSGESATSPVSGPDVCAATRRRRLP